MNIHPILHGALNGAFRGAFGDAGSDTLYAGESGGSVFDVQTWRDRATEFQDTVNRADQTYLAILDAIAETPSSVDTSDLQSLAREYESKRDELRSTVWTINQTSTALNAIGVRFPMLSAPGTLAGMGALPVIPLAIAAGAATAIALAAAAISWAVAWCERAASASEMTRAIVEASTTLPDDKRAAVLQSLSTVAATANSGGGFMGDLAGVVKWAAIGAAAYFAYKAWLA